MIQTTHLHYFCHFRVIFANTLYNATSKTWLIVPQMRLPIYNWNFSQFITQGYDLPTKASRSFPPVTYNSFSQPQLFLSVILSVLNNGLNVSTIASNFFHIERAYQASIKIDFSEIRFSGTLYLNDNFFIIFNFRLNHWRSIHTMRNEPTFLKITFLRTMEQLIVFKKSDILLFCSK